MVPWKANENHSHYGKERVGVKRTLTMMVALVLLGSACLVDDGGGDQRPLVVTTTSILGNLVTGLTGDNLRIEVLIPMGADPHGFSPSARQAAGLREAALVIANGVGLEEGLLDVIEAAEQDGVPVIKVGEFLDPQLFDAGPPGEDGEDAGGLDPHVWMDPIRMSDAVRLIADQLDENVGLDVSDRAAAYQAEILDLHDEIVEMIEELPVERRKMVTNHFSIGYFADRYGLTLLGTVIPAATTGAETSAADFAALAKLLEREEIAVVFGSTTEPTRLADALTEEIGWEVKVVELYTGSLGEAGSGAETYVDMMRTNTRLIVENLGQQ